ncbi:MAG: hypothetical protein LC121_25890, partial [Anaerolineae bacterium]|nr:hypothetical protein [Anaerolineae bacterium]
IEGDEPRFVGFLHDLSDHKRVEAAAHQAQERVAQFARLSTMGEMAAGLAHEINQPLTAVATYAQAVQRMIDRPDVDPDEINHALAQITAQALRAGDVIQRLRAFVRNRDTRREPTDMAKLLRDTLTFAGPDARVNEVRLTAEVPGDFPPVTCDPIQIQQVLLNLIRNAIDATNEIRVAQRDVTVRMTRADAADIEISVEDHGKGVSEEVARRIGDPFFTTKSTGTGLGVASVADRSTRWQTGAPANPGGGATFHFTLPVAPGATHANMFRTALSSTTTGGSHLAAAADPLIGLPVDTFESAQDFWPVSPSGLAVVLDIRMPGMSGWSCSRS